MAKGRKESPNILLGMLGDLYYELVITVICPDHFND